jgi:hypothetical protein
MLLSGPLPISFLEAVSLCFPLIRINNRKDLLVINLHFLYCLEEEKKNPSSGIRITIIKFSMKWVFENSTFTFANGGSFDFLFYWLFFFWGGGGRLNSSEWLFFDDKRVSTLLRTS